MNARGPLSQDAIIRYGVQICALVQYLHSAEAVPILHLDLQPRNLLVCHGQVKLLDFDHSCTLTAANEAGERYGTEGFIAPEQRNGGYLDIRTDIYQIGALLAYLAAGGTQKGGLSASVPGRLGAVIRRCLRREAGQRYGSALELEEALAGLCFNTECPRQLRSPSLTIALVGARRGAGVTHIAIGLAAWLNRNGRPALYVERNRSGDVTAMGERLGVTADSYGILNVLGLPMKPRYGGAVRLDECDYPVVLQDCGTDAAAAAEIRPSAILAVCGGKWWDEPCLSELLERLGAAEREFPAGQEAAEPAILINHMVPGALRRPREWRGSRSLQVPEFPDPFHPDERASSFYESVMSGYLREEERKRRWRIFGRGSAPRGSRGSSA